MLRRLKYKMAAAGLIFVIGPAVVSKTAFAHGTGYRQSEKKPISLEFSYSTGETMSYLEAKVFSPKDEKFAFQSGRTDEDGRFAFTPNARGWWRVVVRDGEGHLAEAKIDVTQEFLEARSEAGVVAPKAAAPEGLDLTVRSALGVSLLFNFAAFVSFVRRGKVK
jgi:nickel transport protein